MTAKPAVDLRLLAYFHKTAEIGNIISAAAALNVAQPTLSKAIQQLERQLAVTLFQRSPTGVVLTQKGEQLLRHTRLVLAQVSDAVEESEALRSGTAGRVRIGAGRLTSPMTSFPISGRMVAAYSAIRKRAISPSPSTAPKRLQGWRPI
ncbi:LysR family transcriptional regulator [Ruegeria sp. 2205SS24-7]|uniref:LysR family transcriptional regulator n=1 Tax=Ruegeria discodermiae TaxID=3064389 RepID=UPI0027415D9C|nr:LysR family transcriptional regulator [Ruegeria sp. 2205SS24-7]MDP5220156.1 LysR family transcriptional regulator [Ruegeria sp. 2205SS24-7]